MGRVCFCYEAIQVLNNESMTLCRARKSPLNIMKAMATRNKMAILFPIAVSKRHNLLQVVAVS